MERENTQGRKLGANTDSAAVGIPAEIAGTLGHSRTAVTVAVGMTKRGWAGIIEIGVEAAEKSLIEGESETGNGAKNKMLAASEAWEETERGAVAAEKQWSEKAEAAAHEKDQVVCERHLGTEVRSGNTA